MPLFGRKNREKPASGCRVAGPEAGSAAAEAARPEGAGVKILGSGCARCSALEAAAREALAQLGMEESVDHVTDFSKIAAYGVMSTPALVVDGKVLSCGKVLKAGEVADLLKKARG